MTHTFFGAPARCAAFAAGALITGLSFFGTAAAWADQPFVDGEHDAVFSDALVARYLVTKEAIFTSNFNGTDVPWCKSTDTLPTQSCTTAIHRFCLGKGFVTGYGFTAPSDSTKAEISCLTSDAVTVNTLAYHDPYDPNNPSVPIPADDPNEERMSEWCMATAPRAHAGWPTPNLHCSVGIDRLCGADGGFGPVERAYGNQVQYACFAPGIIESTTAAPSTLIPGGECDGLYGFAAVPDACSQAMAEYCADQNLLGGYGPREGSPGSVKVGCVHESDVWAANAQLPDPPAKAADILRRDIHLVGGTPQFKSLLHNHLAESPAQSYDGRVVMGALDPAQRVQFYAQIPEIFTAPLSEDQSVFGATRVRSDYYRTQDTFKYYIEPTEVATLFDTDGGSRKLGPSMAVCDPPRSPMTAPHHNQSQNIPDRDSNPYRCTSAGVETSGGDHDCYDLTLIMRSYLPGTKELDELWATPVKVVMAYPKTEPANSGVDAAVPHVVDVQVRPNGETSTKLTVGDGHQILEPVISGNGRLLIAQVDGHIQYSVVPETESACDPGQWTAWKHISEMYADPLMSSYGLAKFPLRDAEDNVISNLPGESVYAIRGAYPWVDRDGDNLFFIAADQAMYYIDDNDQLQERLPIAGHPLPGVTATSPSDIQDFVNSYAGGVRIGLSMVGLWTQGKFSTPDTRHNNIDITIKDDFPQLHRLVDLFTGGATEIGSTAKVVINSPESQFNYLSTVRPEAPRDVVWKVATQMDTDEVVFDDVNHPRAFIVSEMSASLNMQGPIRGRYNDGFEWDYSAVRDYPGFDDEGDASLLKFQGRGFTRAAHVANTASAVSQAVVDFAAAATPSGQANPLAGAVQWNVPTYGRVLGGARTEAVAAGGYRGKGVWLDGDDWIEYLVPPQPDAADFATTPWFATISVEPTLDGGASWWRLLTLPDGSALDLRSDGQVVRLDWGQATPAEIFLSSSLALQDGKWTTLAVLSEAGAPSTLSIFVDGLRIVELSDSTLEPFRVQVGDIRVGADGEAGGGVVGWVDDFKIIGAAPTHEEVCNHAGGTLRGLAPGSPSELYSLASSYRVGSGDIHADLTGFINTLPGSPSTYSDYICERQETFTGAKTCLGATHGPMSAECLRPLVNGLNEALVWNANRPDAVQNPFCLSCHVESNPSLTMRPSTALAEELTTLWMHDDPRRQPMQAAPFLFGAIPPNYFGPGNPGTTPPDPVNLDEQTNP
ncbi:MAG: hypothetical protein AAGM22_11975 [Acidobacteriota bacterium]